MAGCDQLGSWLNAVPAAALLDTLLVGALLVPALVVVLGRQFWWPGDPSAAPDLFPDLLGVTS